MLQTMLQDCNEKCNIISSFAEDSDGELLLIDYSGGGLYRVVAAGVSATAMLLR